MDAVGVHGETLTLLQCKYQESDKVVQRWNEIGQFMDFAEDTGVHTSLPFFVCHWENTARLQVQTAE